MATTKFRNKRRRKPGDLSSLRRSIWAGLLTAEELCDNENPEIQLRALNAISQLAGAYLRTIEQADFEQRITALEDQNHIRSQENGRSHVQVIR